jgi:hypothetical protein
MLSSGLLLCVLAGLSTEGTPSAVSAISAVEVAERGGFSLLAQAGTSERGVVRIHIESDNPAVELQRIGGTAYGGRGDAVLLEPVCNAPCDQVVNARAGSFVLVGEGIPPSPRFQLSSYEGDLTLRVKAGDSGRLGLGAAGIGISIFTGIASVIGFIVAATLSPTRQARGEHIPSLIVGIAGAGATLVFGGGGFLLASGAGTSYTIETHPTQPRDRSVNTTVVQR